MLRCFNPKADRDDFDRVTPGLDSVADLGIKTVEGERNSDKIAAVPTLAMGNNSIKAKTQLYDQRLTMDNDSQRFVRELARRSIFRSVHARSEYYWCKAVVYIWPKKQCCKTCEIRESCMGYLTPSSLSKNNRDSEANGSKAVIKDLPCKAIMHENVMQHRPYSSALCESCASFAVHRY